MTQPHTPAPSSPGPRPHTPGSPASRFSPPLQQPVPVTPTSPVVAARVLGGRESLDSDSDFTIDGDDSDEGDEKIASYASRRLKEMLPPTVVQLYENNVGMFLIAMAQFFFACMSMSVKFLMEKADMSVLALIGVRMSVTGLFCIVTLLIQRDPHPFLGPPGMRKLLVLRGFCGFGGLLCAYQALRGLSVSDAVTIGFLAPSMVALLAFILLGESFSVKEMISGFISLFGVILISRPPFIFGHGWGGAPPIEHPEVAMTRVRLQAAVEADDNERMLGVSWALAGVCFASGAYLTIRVIGKRASALHSISYFSLMCTFASTVGIIIDRNPVEWPHTTYGFSLIFLIGTFGFVAQVLLTFGLQREKAGRAGLAMYLQIFFAVILEGLVFHVVPSLLSFIGTVVILSSAGWVAMSTLKSQPPPVVEDPESRPLSRSPSPVPVGRKTVRGEFYSYAAIPTDDVDTRASSSATLEVPDVTKD